MLCCLKRLTAISIHALRGEGDDALDLNVRRAADISIHALRGEGDGITVVKGCSLRSFQSTPSVGRATLLLLSL